MFAPICSECYPVTILGHFQTPILYWIHLCRRLLPVKESVIITSRWTMETNPTVWGIFKPAFSNFDGVKGAAVAGLHLEPMRLAQLRRLALPVNC